MATVADVEELLETFMELSWSEPCPLEQFVERLAAGVYGKVSRAEIRALIDRVERITIGNLEVKADEGPGWRERADEVAEEELRRFAELRRRYRD